MDTENYMKVWEEKHKLRLPKSHDRSSGLHVSEIIRDLAVEGGVLDPKWIQDTILELQDTNMMQLGLAFEDYLGTTGQHPEIEYHIGELSEVIDCCEVCGQKEEDHYPAFGLVESVAQTHAFVATTVYLSIDGLSLVDPDIYADIFAYSVNFVHEFKFTKKSSRDFAQSLRTEEKKVLMWLWQIKAYCKAAQTLAAKLHVEFVNGNYSREEPDEGGMAPYKIFRLVFTEEEIETNWNMLVAHAREMIQKGRYKAPCR